jgi:hypothetical protein
VQSHHHQGVHYSCLLKLQLQPHHHTPMYFNWLF